MSPFQEIYFLKRHLQINRIENVEICAVAVSDCSAITPFLDGESSSTGRLANKGNILVGTVSLDELVCSGRFEYPDFVKIDVEGGEMEVLLGANTIIEEAHPTIFLATHGDTLRVQCHEYLSSKNYRINPIGNDPIKVSDEVVAVYS